MSYSVGKIQNQTKIIYRKKHYIVGKPMTLVQASICNNGNSIILIADRLLTRRISEENEYEFEGVEPKIVELGKVGIGFAGISYYGETIIDTIRDKIGLDEICKGIGEGIKEERNKIIDSITRQLTCLPRERFFSGNHQVPSKIIEMVYGAVGEVSINIEFLVTGFDEKNEARIVYIDDRGNIYDVTNFGVYPIGSGQQFSQMFFDMYEYNISISEIEGLLFAYRAKKWGEAPRGVGKRTDVLIIRKDGKNTFIKNEDILMKEIEKAFKRENEEIKKNKKRNI